MPVDSPNTGCIGAGASVELALELENKMNVTGVPAIK